MFTWFSSWMVGPLVLGAAAALVSLPIIIHLLNKRKFRIVDWAAIEFLLDADKRNRRRLRLENLILLLLRCLAVLLLGLMLARPFACSPLAARLLDAEQFERIVLLDDSLSMQMKFGNHTTFDEAKQRLTEIVRSLAENDSDDTLTLVLTSNPDQFRFNATAVTPDSIQGIVEVIDDLSASDRPANLAAALQEVERHLESQAPNVNRVVYVVSDLRRRDWQVEGESSDDENQPIAVLRRVSQDANGCFVVDVADQPHNNLVLAEVRPEESLLAGVRTRFDATVTNYGESEANNVRVTFIAGDSPPQTAEIPTLAAGQSEKVSFSFTFGVPIELEPGVAPDVTQPPTPERVRIEVTSNQPNDEDRLPADSLRFFAARVQAGVPTLIVDGDPSASTYRAESAYLRYALAPPGQYLSGVLVKVVTDTELESETLSNYQVVFLCNVFRLSQPRIDALTEWVSQGGGLVIMPGDQVDEEDFNERLFKNGTGLSPVRLEGIHGDETEESWVNIQVAATNHPVFHNFEGQNNPLLDAVKIFRWWSVATAEGEAAQDVTVSMRLSDVDESIALAEKPFGKGRVVATSMPGDRDWSTWAELPSFIPAMGELVHYLAGRQDSGSNLIVGEPIRQPLDLTLYQMDAIVRPPAGDGLSDDPPSNVQATRGDESLTDAGDTVWWLDFPGTDRRGFYEMQLTRNDAGIEGHLFAANVEPAEGDLRRIEPPELREELDGANVVIVSGPSAANQVVRGANQDMWKYVLGALVGVLCCEQLLGWLFGRRR